MTGVMKKISIYSIVFLLFTLPQAALAQVVITEVMYDPIGADGGYEWIEIYNVGASAAALTTWKLVVGDAKHNIFAASNDKLLASHSFAIIAASVAKFQADYPNFSGQLFHSALSLSNSGTTIELHDASSTIEDSVSYESSSGALSDGNSLQRPPDHTAQFSPYAPSPGSGISTAKIPPKVKASVPVKSSKSSKRKSSKASPVDHASDFPDPYPTGTDTADEIVSQAPNVSQLASLATTSPNDGYWWLAAGALAAVAGGTIFVSKRFKKTEWDIVEEKPEDV
jgi:hypothetical protein